MCDTIVKVLKKTSKKTRRKSAVIPEFSLIDLVVVSVLWIASYSF